MPGPHMEVNTGQGPLQISTLLGQYLCLSITGIQCVTSVGLCVLQNTGPASLNSTDSACMGFLDVLLCWALSETESGLSLDVHWYQAKYVASVKKKPKL